MEKLLGKSPAELETVVRNCGLKPFVAKQIARWLYVSKVRSIDEMTNISKEGREILKSRYELGASAPIGKAESSDGTLKYIFKVQTPLTEAGEALTEFVNNLNLPEGDSLEKSRFIMHEVYKHFEYVPKSTSIATSAEESFALGKGVCQDYSQSMLSICRSLGIPCRYVTGLLMGEGETHAWTEIYSDGKWYGLDPTNDVEVSENHIVISTGRDSADCSINRGIFRGSGTQSQKIYVKVEEVHDTNSNAG